MISLFTNRKKTGEKRFMTDIDLKDRKILYHLDLNCRQSNSQIGKKVGLSRKVVEYRINKMEEEGIIAGYWTNIDAYKFGYDVYRYYLVLQNATPSIKEKMIQKLIEYENTWVVAKILGIYDITLVIWVKDVQKFYHFWDKFNEQYGDYLSEKLFSIYLQADHYPSSFLISNENKKFVDDRKKYVEKVGGKPVNIDFTDYKLLNKMAENARMPLVDLSDALNQSSQSISYRMKNLMKRDVIQGYHVALDVSKLGLKHFKVDIWLREVSKRRKIWNKLRINPNVTFINTSAGYADLEAEFTIESSEKIIEFMEAISSEFPNAIRKYIHWRGVKGYKLRCLPELTEKDFKR